jgi:hypothetical protein
MVEAAVNHPTPTGESRIIFTDAMLGTVSVPVPSPRNTVWSTFSKSKGLGQPQATQGVMASQHGNGDMEKEERAARLRFARHVSLKG